MKAWVYPVICFVVPQLWAVVFARGAAAWERRQERAARRRAADQPKDFAI